MIVFQVDLFSSKAKRPKTMMDVMAREKEIRFSSRTRQISRSQLQIRNARATARRVLDKLPPELRDDKDVQALAQIARDKALALVQLIYRANDWEGGSRDYEFSERTKEEHWQAGRDAVAHVIGKAGVIATDLADGKIAEFDLAPR